jgi:SMC interacting uncharacterized protein involved in chromosome segregation
LTISIDEIIANLRDQLEESYRDFELLSLDWDKIDTLVKAKSGGEIDGLRSQASLANTLRDKIKALKDMHNADIDKIKLLQTQVEGKEKELLELRERIDGYEKGCNAHF